MSSLVGCLLVPTTKNQDTGLWFIFHHESDGILAFDITTEHPEIPFRHFETSLDGGMHRSLRDKIVYLGGPNQSDNAVLILHNGAKETPDTHIVSKDFSFQSYRYALIPGHPPSISKADDTPSRIALAPHAEFLIVMGFRLWAMDILENELKNWQWTLLPASPEIVFRTPRKDRLQKARLAIN